MDTTFPVGTAFTYRDVPLTVTAVDGDNRTLKSSNSGGTYTRTVQELKLSAEPREVTA